MDVNTNPWRRHNSSIDVPKRNDLTSTKSNHKKIQKSIRVEIRIYAESSKLVKRNIVS